MKDVDDALIYTDTRPRAKSTGHAFGFEGNLGLPVIISAMGSILLLTLLFTGSSTVPLPVRFAAGLTPVVLTTTYVVTLRSRRPPRYDVDLLRSAVNGRAFQPARLQPFHPCLQPQRPGPRGHRLEGSGDLAVDTRRAWSGCSPVREGTI